MSGGNASVGEERRVRIKRLANVQSCSLQITPVRKSTMLGRRAGKKKLLHKYIQGAPSSRSILQVSKLHPMSNLINFFFSVPLTEEAVDVAFCFL